MYVFVNNLPYFPLRDGRSNILIQFSRIGINLLRTISGEKFCLFFPQRISVEECLE
jgi:hypothetical protein